MRTFIELLARDGGRLLIETASIVGLKTAPHKSKADNGTQDSPVTIILRNAAPVEVTMISAAMILGKVIAVIKKAEEVEARDGREALPLAVVWLDHGDLDGLTDGD